jgi:hypothetical protein
MTEDKIQRLRDAGISEDVIIDMMKKPEEGRSEGYIDPAAPSSTFTQAQAAGAPVAGPETSMTQLATETTTLIPDALKYGGGAALGVYGLRKLGQAMGGRTPAVAPTAPAAVPTAPVAPVAPVAIEPGGQQLKDFVQQRGQYTRPTVPGQPVVGAPQTAGIGRDIATDKIIRETALERVLRGVAPYAKVAGGLAAAAMPGNMGQNYPFPQTGPMQGQEINPNTGRPWTPAELQQYNAQFQ